MIQMKIAKSEVHEQLMAAHMIPVFNHTDAEVCFQVISACYAGGSRVFEYTNRGAEAAQVFEVLAPRVKTVFPDLLLGVGSIFDVQEAGDYASLGADFIVQPIINPEVAQWCEDNELYWIPGAGTTTEVWQASNLGAGIIKVFPGDVLGPSFVKSVLGPMPGLQLMPTGGVTPEPDNLKTWIDAGVVCMGMGSKLITKDIIRDADYSSLTQRVSKALNWIKTYRDEKN